MTVKGIRMLLMVSLLLLINFESQSVSAMTNDETESSEALESAPSNEINEPIETQKPTPENEVSVSDQVSIEPKIAHAGEQRLFSLTLPEEISFETIVLSYLSSNTQTETAVELTYDDAKKQYVGLLETTKETTSGQWLLIKAVGIDENEVSSVLETRNLTNEDIELKAGDFEVLSHPSSLVDLTSIKVEPKAVKVGGNLQFSLHSVENERLTNVTVVYRLFPKVGESSDHQLLLSLTFNEEAKAYEGELASITNELMGDWVIDHLSGSDEQGNSFTLYNQFVIGLDKENLQKQINELNKQLLIEQTAAETEDTGVQETRDLLLEKIQQLESLKAAKEKQLQADLSIGTFTIEEQVIEEEPDTIDEEMPMPIEEESSTPEKEAETSLAESKMEVSKEEMTVDLKGVQKKAIATSSKNENQASTKESAQAIDATSVSEETVTDEKNKAVAFSNSSLFIVLAAFVIINGFIFKF